MPLPTRSPRTVWRALAHSWLIIVMLALLIPQATPAHAAGAITVDTLTDKPLNSSDTDCTLRAAIQAANTTGSYAGCTGGSSIPGPDGNLITFAAPGLIKLTQGDISVISNIAILGPVALDGDGKSRIFRISSSGSLSLSLMTLQNGYSSGGGGAILVSSGSLNIAGVSFENNKADGDGGAINNDSAVLRVAAGNFIGNKSTAGNGGAIWSSGSGQSLIVAASNFAGNSVAAGKSGGAIYNSNSNGSAEISDVLFSGNLATGNETTGGGAIFNAQNGVLTVIRSGFSGNLSPSGNGGAIFNNNSGTLTIRDSSFQGNLAGTPPATNRGGGALFNWGILSVTGSTFLNNAVVGDGGAISNDRKGTLTVVNTSFTANASTVNGGALNNINSQQGNPSGTTATLINTTFSVNVTTPLGAGGALFNGTGQALSIANTIVADGVPTNCAGTITSGGHNLDSAASCGLNQSGDLNNADAKLDIPFFNGGPFVSLLTQKLKPGSAAIDTGDPAICAAAPVSNVDQRDEPRPTDGNGDATAICDIGAFENDAVFPGFGSTPVDPGPIDVGNAQINTTVNGTFSVYETGNAPLTITGATLGGNNPGNFSFNTPLPITLNDGDAPQTLALSCTPSALGARTATLTLATNDQQNASVLYNLTCDGTPQPQAGFGSTPGAPGPLNAGTVYLGQSKVAKLQLFETGNAPLSVNTPVLSGENASEFAIDPALNLSFNDGAQPITVDITCTPSDVGIRAAKLTLKTSDPTLPTVSFNLVCTGAIQPLPPFEAGGGAGSPAGPGNNGVYGVAISPDGKHVYATDRGDDQVMVLSRNTANGALTFVQNVTNLQGGVSGLDSPYLVTVSPDGKNVYVASSGSDSVVAFARNAESGALTFVDKVTEGQTYGFCLPNDPSCLKLEGMSDPYAMLVSPDGRYIYISSIIDSAVVVLQRSETDGGISLGLLGPEQIYTNPAMVQAYGMALSPDGAQLYVTGYNSSSMLVLNRNAADGRVSFVEKHAQGENGVDGLDGAFRVAVSPDGALVATAAFQGNSVALFRRNPADGKLTYLTRYLQGENGVDGIDTGTAVAWSPGGEFLYATGYTSAATAIFRREEGGEQLEFAQKIARDATTGLPPLNGARDLAVSPDGKQVYVAGFLDNQVAILNLANPRPRLSSISPSSATAGGPQFTITAKGANFLPDSQLHWNGQERPTSFVSGSELTAVISAGDIAAVGTASVTIVNPAPGGGPSNALPFAITPPGDNPRPVIEALLPQGVAAGAPAFTLVVKGSNFVSGARVLWNGEERATVFVSASTLQATIATSDVAQPGPASVSVLNPAPGGGTSNAATFTVSQPGTTPPPAINSLQPASLNVGVLTASSFTISVIGSSFQPSSEVYWNGEQRPSAFVSETELVATISAADVATVGTAGVMVITPAPGGGESNTATFRIGARGDNPLPTLEAVALSPGNGGITLTVQGSDLVEGVVVRWRGSDKPTTRLSATQLTVTLQPTDLAGGTAVITALNPGPGGGASNELIVTLQQAYVPLVIR